MRLDETPVFFRATVARLGSLDKSAEDHLLLGSDVVPWTHCQDADDPFAEVEIRGVLLKDGSLVWLSGDAELDILEPPGYLGQPEELSKLARPVTAPAGSTGAVQTPEGWPDLVWKSDALFSAVRGWDDPQVGIEILLCAAAVAPDTSETHDVIFAAIKARFVKLVRNSKTYPPAENPWRSTNTPDELLLDILRL